MVLLLALVSLMLLLLLLTAQCSLASPRELHIVYMGSSDPALHPDAVTQLHYSILQEVLISSPGEEEEALVYSYKHGFSGFAAYLTRAQAERLSEMPGVVSVFPNRRAKLHTTESWDFLGLTEDRERSFLGPDTGTSLWKRAKFGRDVIIGSIDSGVWPESASFDDRGLGPVPRRWKGVCQGGDGFNASNCNRKLVGARYFYSDGTQDEGDFMSARDSSGHGTHTASIAAGRFVEDASTLHGFGRGRASGGAPAARIAAYKVCWPSDCFTSDVLAAFDAAFADGVDVITISLGFGEPQDYLKDVVALGAFHAAQRGVLVVASAGNEGPRPGSVENVAPWTLVVGASTIDRIFVAQVRLGNNATIQGHTLSEYKLDKVMYPLISAADVSARNSSSNESQYCFVGTLDPEKVKGKVVACLAGINYRVRKGLAVLNAGGAGMILCNSQQDGNDVVADSHILPAAHVSATDADLIYAYIRSSRNPTVYISPPRTKTNVKPAPSMTTFSSQGPSKLTPDVLQPDITAPGLNILGAYSQAASPSHLDEDRHRVNYSVMSGTSMSCPHVAGVAALLKAYHPDWSPAAIKSAIVTTGYVRDNLKGPMLDANLKPATPFAFGGGHINPNAAAHPGLVYDADEREYMRFLCGLKRYSKSALEALSSNSSSSRLGMVCSEEVEASDLNYPSIGISSLKGTRSITRRVTYVEEDGPTAFRASVLAPPGVDVSVVPSELSFEQKDETKSFQVKFRVMEASCNESYEFGYLIWRNDKYTVKSPIAVVPAQV